MIALDMRPTIGAHMTNIDYAQFCMLYYYYLNMFMFICRRFKTIVWLDNSTVSTEQHWSNVCLQIGSC
jgi:hypothetical protein